MGKGKGRQSGGFGYKSQRAAYHQEVREQIAKVQLSRPRRIQQQQMVFLTLLYCLWLMHGAFSEKTIKQFQIQQQLIV